MKQDPIISKPRKDFEEYRVRIWATYRELVDEDVGREFQ